MSLGVALGVGGAAGVALGVDVAGVAPIPGELQRHADAPAKLTIGGAGALSDVGGWVALGVDDAAGLAPPAALGVDVAGVDMDASYTRTIFPLPEKTSAQIFIIYFSKF